MSIIYEALKKVEKEENALGRQSKRNPFKSPPHNKAKSRSRIVFFIFGVLVFFSFYLFIQRYAKIAFNVPLKYGLQGLKVMGLLPRRLDQPRPAAVRPAREELVAPAVLTAIEKTKKYYLQGIIYDQDRPLALINGKKVGLGEAVDEALLTQVSRRGVEIETETGKIFLPL